MSTTESKAEAFDAMMEALGRVLGHLDYAGDMLAELRRRAERAEELDNRWMGAVLEYYPLDKRVDPIQPEMMIDQLVRHLTREVDQAGDMLAVERARAARWKAGAKRARRDAKRWCLWWTHLANRLEEEGDRKIHMKRDLVQLAAERGRALDRVAYLERERDEARAALMRRISHGDASGA